MEVVDCSGPKYAAIAPACPGRAAGRAAGPGRPCWQGGGREAGALLHLRLRFVEKYSWAWAAKVRDLFSRRGEGPASCSSMRSTIGKRDTGGWAATTTGADLNQLLAEMDGFDSARASSFCCHQPAGVLDPALLRGLTGGCRWRRDLQGRIA